MVATFVLLNLALTQWAGLDVNSGLFSPAFHLLLDRFITSDIFAVPRFFTLVADFCRARWASKFSGIGVLSSNSCVTARLGTPPD
jgi:hypothetical protein